VTVPDDLREIEEAVAKIVVPAAGCARGY